MQVVKLPPYSPQLNPIEKLWDILKEGLCNKAYANITQLRKAMSEQLQAYWQEPALVLRLIGRNWLTHTLNAFSPMYISVFNGLWYEIRESRQRTPRARTGVLRRVWRHSG